MSYCYIYTGYQIADYIFIRPGSTDQWSLSHIILHDITRVRTRIEQFCNDDAGNVQDIWKRSNKWSSNGIHHARGISTDSAHGGNLKQNSLQEECTVFLLNENRDTN